MTGRRGERGSRFSSHSPCRSVTPSLNLCGRFILASTKFDSQPPAPPPAITEMRSFKRIAEVVSEKLVGDIQDVNLGRANDLFSLEQIDAGGEVEDRSRLDAPALEVHEFGARRGFQLFQPFLFDLQRHAALVPSSEAEQ